MKRLLATGLLLALALAWPTSTLAQVTGDGCARDPAHPGACYQPGTLAPDDSQDVSPQLNQDALTSAMQAASTCPANGAAAAKIQQLQSDVMAAGGTACQLTAVQIQMLYVNKRLLQICDPPSATLDAATQSLDQVINTSRQSYDDQGCSPPLPANLEQMSIASLPGAIQPPQNPPSPPKNPGGTNGAGGANTDIGGGTDNGRGNSPGGNSTGGAKGNGGDNSNTDNGGGDTPDGGVDPQLQQFANTVCAQGDPQSSDCQSQVTQLATQSNFAANQSTFSATNVAPTIQPLSQSQIPDSCGYFTRDLQDSHGINRYANNAFVCFQGEGYSCDDDQWVDKGVCLQRPDDPDADATHLEQSHFNTSVYEDDSGG